MTVKALYSRAMCVLCHSSHVTMELFLQWRMKEGALRILLALLNFFLNDFEWGPGGSLHIWPLLQVSLHALVPPCKSVLFIVHLISVSRRVSVSHVDRSCLHRDHHFGAGMASTPGTDRTTGTGRKSHSKPQSPVLLAILKLSDPRAGNRAA